MMMAEPMRAVLLDRDGTLNPDPGYLDDPDRFELFPDVITGLRAMQAAGYRLAVVTNQSGVGRGLIAPAALAAIHRRLQELLRAGGVTLAGIFVCPHRPDEDCGCRKPRPGLVDAAVRDLGLDRAGCWVIGDRRTDVDMALAAGVRPILLRRPPSQPAVATPDGSAGDVMGGVSADVPVVATLVEAAELLINTGVRGG